MNIELSKYRIYTIGQAFSGIAKTAIAVATVRTIVAQYQQAFSLKTYLANDNGELLSLV